MQKKKGISLIVLVITIIVMIILAATIILAINNNNIVDKAKDAVTETNLKQVQELAQTLWADAYIDGARTQQELYDAVMEGLEEANVDTSKYTIIVTTSGATVTAQAMNEYGFYFDKLYVTNMPEGSSTTKQGYVLHADGTAEFYVATSYTNNVLYCMAVAESGLEYSEKQVTYLPSESEEEEIITFSDDGLTATYKGATFTYSAETLHGVYTDRYYSGTSGDNAAKFKVNSSLTTVTTVVDSTTQEVTITSIKGKNHIITVAEDSVYISADGTSATTSVTSGIILKLESQSSDQGSETVDELEGAVITPVEGSSVEAIKAGNPTVGDTIEYNGYIYKYNQVCDNAGEWETISDYSHGEGWGVTVQDKTLETYPDMESTIYTVPVKFLLMTFVDCTNMATAPALSSEACTLMAIFMNCTKLTAAPVLPDGVTEMFGAFYNCTALTTVQNLPSNVTSLWCTFQKCTNLTTIPELPSKITNMCAAFDGCESLTSVSAIPATVTNLLSAFKNCTSLEGTITINATNLSDYDTCFAGTVKDIILAKTDCPVLSEIAATATNGNVTIEE